MTFTSQHPDCAFLGTYVLYTGDQDDDQAAVAEIHLAMSGGSYEVYVQSHSGGTPIATFAKYPTYEEVVEAANKAGVAPEPDYEVCPHCGGPLEPDVEYMGEGYQNIPRNEQTLYCDDCDLAGTYEEILNQEPNE